MSISNLVFVPKSPIDWREDDGRFHWYGHACEFTDRERSAMSAESLELPPYVRYNTIKLRCAKAGYPDASVIEHASQNPAFDITETIQLV